ncbi:hypothetical protein RHGRI_013225 [Rhododendron griersonianum]|uniref:Glycine-rich protein n=1 Tax=Rhododendron griersonianum TaxID=479676 RepID=A0AAV6K549_9ERIC|nr:hypothetical protein RHGRI_013225 [Rhododendron griersonianum]
MTTTATLNPNVSQTAASGAGGRRPQRDPLMEVLFSTGQDGGDGERRRQRRRRRRRRRRGGGGGEGDGGDGGSGGHGRGGSGSGGHGRGGSGSGGPGDDPNDGGGRDDQNDGGGRDDPNDHVDASILLMTIMFPFKPLMFAFKWDPEGLLPQRDSRGSCVPMLRRFTHKVDVPASSL